MDLTELITLSRLVWPYVLVVVEQLPVTRRTPKPMLENDTSRPMLRGSPLDIDDRLDPKVAERHHIVTVANEPGTVRVLPKSQPESHDPVHNGSGGQVECQHL